MMPVQNDAQAFAYMQAMLEMAYGMTLTIDIEPSHRARLQSAIDSARAELARLDAACNEQTTHGSASCMDEPSPAVATAGLALGRSLEEMGQILAAKRRIMPPDDPDKRPKQCIPRPVCPHRGGDAHHDRCADQEPPNMHFGCDVHLNGKLFDALNAQGEMWEVKTDAWSGYSRFLRGLTLAAHLAEARLEKSVALACGHPFVFAVADASLHRELSTNLTDIDVRHVPQCTR